MKRLLIIAVCLLAMGCVDSEFQAINDSLYRSIERLKDSNAKLDKKIAIARKKLKAIENSEYVGLVSDYTIYTEKVKSIIAPELFVKPKDNFRCPLSCKEIIPLPEHGEFYECCGYEFMNYGNAIHILGKSKPSD